MELGKDLFQAISLLGTKKREKENCTVEVSKISTDIEGRSTSSAESSGANVAKTADENDQNLENQQGTGTVHAFAADDSYTESEKRYLMSVLKLSKELTAVRPIDVAKDLGFSKASVSVALKKLRDKGLVRFDDCGFVFLTDTVDTTMTEIQEKEPEYEFMSDSLLSESSKKYLRGLVELSKELAVVRSVDLANKLQISKPSVSTALKKLVESGYVVVDQYGFISLSDKIIVLGAPEECTKEHIDAETENVEAHHNEEETKPTNDIYALVDSTEQSGANACETANKNRSIKEKKDSTSIVQLDVGSHDGESVSISLYGAILKLNSVDEYWNFFGELVGPTEYQKLEQRAQIAKLLGRNATYNELKLPTPIRCVEP